MLKVGYTKQSPYDRMKDLYTSGVPTPFVLENYYFVEDACMCEELIHIRMNRFRVNDDREFFKTDVEKARRVVEQAIDDMRERLWTNQPLKNEAKNESIITPQFVYSNPKFKEMMKLLKSNKKLLSVEEISKSLKISSGGVDKLILMMNKQEGTMLYTREDNRVKKYTMSYAFNVHQLKLLSERFPDLNLIELKTLFEEPIKKFTSSNKSVSNNSKKFLEEKIKTSEKDLVTDNSKIVKIKEEGLSRFERLLNGGKINAVKP